MTTITEGMTPAQFLAAVNANFLTTFGTGNFTAITDVLTADLETALNTNFLNSVSIVGVSGSSFISQLNTNFIFSYNSVFEEIFTNTLSDFAFLGCVNISPSIYYNGKTYIAYSGNSCDPYITTYNHATGAFATPVKVGTNWLADSDFHGAPSLLIDNDGYIHCMWGAHVSAIYYSKSNNPEDISAWTAQGSPATGSYPQLLQFSDDTIYLFYRVGSDLTTTDWGYKTSGDGGTTWSAYTKLIDEGFAYCAFKKGIGDIIHCTFNLNDSDADRQNVYYMYYSGGNWKNISGTNLSMPLAPPQPTVLAYDSGSEWVPMHSYHWDASNNIYILFSEGHTANPASGGPGTFTYKIVKYISGSWHSYEIGATTDNWRDYMSCIDVRSANDIDVYLISEGIVDAIGGNINKHTSSDGGETWILSKHIKEGQFVEPVMVTNYGSNNVKLLFAEYNATSTVFAGRGYLWGDSGFINKRIDN